MSSLLLRYTIKGACNMTPDSSKCPLRPPVSGEMLAMLSNELDHEDPEDACVLSCATTATMGQARLGELLSGSSSKHNPSAQPSFSDLRALRLPRTKTTGNAGATIFLCSQHDRTDPIGPLTCHILINDPPSHYPLFLYCSQGGYIALMK